MLLPWGLLASTLTVWGGVQEVSVWGLDLPHDNVIHMEVFYPKETGAVGLILAQELPAYCFQAEFGVRQGLSGIGVYLLHQQLRLAVVGKLHGNQLPPDKLHITGCFVQNVALQSIRLPDGVPAGLKVLDQNGALGVGLKFPNGAPVLFRYPEVSTPI